MSTSSTVSRIRFISAQLDSGKLDGKSVEEKQREQIALISDCEGLQETRLGYWDTDRETLIDEKDTTEGNRMMVIVKESNDPEKLLGFIKDTTDHQHQIGPYGMLFSTDDYGIEARVYRFNPNLEVWTPLNSVHQVRDEKHRAKNPEAETRWQNRCFGYTVMDGDCNLGAGRDGGTGLPVVWKQSRSGIKYTQGFVDTLATYSRLAKEGTASDTVEYILAKFGK